MARTPVRLSLLSKIPENSGMLDFSGSVWVTSTRVVGGGALRRAVALCTLNTQRGQEVDVVGGGGSWRLVAISGLIENPRVGGSIPPPGTIKSNKTTI